MFITGAEPIGIMAAAVAKHIGARHVVITDINQDRLDLAGQVAVITHHLNVDDFEAGFTAMKSGSSGKVILDWANNTGTPK